MQSAPAHLRPMDMSDLLDGIFRLYRNNFLTFVGSVALILVPFAVIQTVLMTSFQVSMLSSSAPSAFGAGFFHLMMLSLGGFGLVALLESIIAQPILFGAVVWVSAQRLNGQPVSLLGAYGLGGRRILSMIAATVLLGLASLVAVGLPVGLLVLSLALAENSDPGPLLMLVPIVVMLVFLAGIGMIFVTVRLILSSQAIVIEGLAPVAAFKRSWVLTRDSFWRIAGLSFLLGLIVSIVSMVIAGTVQGSTMIVLLSDPSDPSIVGLVQAVNTLSQYLVNILIFPIYGIFSTLLYYDLLVRREGSDLQQMMDDAMPLPAPQA